MGRGNVRNRYLFVADILFAVISHMLVIAVVYPLEIFARYFGCVLYNIPATAVLYCIVLKTFKIYNVDWVHASVKEYLSLVTASVIAAILSVIFGVLFNNPYAFIKFNLAVNAALITLICALRLAVRLILKLSAPSGNGKTKKVLIIGAGELAVTLIRDIQSNVNLSYDIIGLIDDDPHKKNLRICGTTVLGNRNDIIEICERNEVEEIIFAIYAANSEQKKEILNICTDAKCNKVRILPSIDAILENKKNLFSQIRDIQIEDLLERDPIKLDNKLVSDDIFGKTVLVTGGGGSIGSELCRQIIKHNPKKLIIVDIYENTTYELQNELEANYPKQDLEVLIASVRDLARLETIFSEYRPDIVFHAAAHKHVPLMEYSPGESIKNNVFGTYNTVICAEKYNVKRFVLISTDKAVNPTNVMGASKRLCEMIVQTFSKNSKTDFVAVRFGNVLGSNGSVIPFFKKQIANGGPVTVTHPEITRFFMTIPEAAQLVLQAGSYAKGGEIFILDMGQPVKIYDLAKKMIRFSGLKPNVDIKIEFTGLRPGEKLYEELLMSEEGLKKTNHNKIFVGQPIEMTMDELDEVLAKLKNALSKDNDEIKKIVSEVVPTYKYQTVEKSLV